MELLSAEDCKKIISKLGFELGVPPKLVISRLLSEEDRFDMKAGYLPIESLRCHIKVWGNNGMPDYVKEHKAPSSTLIALTL